MNRNQLINLFKKLWVEIHTCTEDNPCCRDEEDHNYKLGKVCELSVHLQKLGIDIDKLIFSLRVYVYNRNP